MRAWGRLLRLSLSPTAAADIAAGTVLAAGAWPHGREPWLLILASLCVYHGGLVLNDWADRDIDRAARPDRPIPSGRVPADAALTVGLLLLAAGPLIALTVQPSAALLLAFVAVAAYTYDLGRRGPLAGPALLAACRAGNITVGISYGLEIGGRTTTPQAEAALLSCALLYGVYVFFVSRLGRLEDAEALPPQDRRPASYLCTAAAALLMVPVLPAHPAVRSALLGHGQGASAVQVWCACLLAVAGAWGLFRLALATPRWTSTALVSAMGAALRRLLVFTAITAMLSSAAEGWIVATVILAGYPVAYVLRGWFPPS